MSKSSKYSYAERKAYWKGAGAKIGFGKVKNINRVTRRMTAKEKQSFYNGFDGVK